MAVMTRFSDSLPMLLLKAREAALSRLRPIFNSRGITEQQWRALRALEEFGELSAARLAAECSILAPSMTRILRKLAEHELVNVAKSRRDHRELQVQIAPKGQQLIAEIGPQIEQQYALLREHLTTERLGTLHQELRHFIERAPANGDEAEQG